MMLSKSQNDKIVTTLDAGLQRQLEDLRGHGKGGCLHAVRWR